MKRIRIAALLLIGAFLFSGCSLSSIKDENNYDLPANASEFSKIYDQDIGEMTIDVYGRTYTYFGTLEDKKIEYTIKDCLGFVEHDERTRLYTLAEDPYDNYIMMKNLDSLTGDTMFLRANETMHKSIFTPSYISSLGFECWCDSGVSNEMPEATIKIQINDNNVKTLSYEFEINGSFAGGGEKEYFNGKPFKNRDQIYLGLNEVDLGDKADPAEPFNLKLTFKVTDMENITREVTGAFIHDMMLGGYYNGIEINCSETGEYFLNIY